MRAGANAANTTANANTTVRVATPGGASVGAAPQVTGRSCRVQVATIPSNGVLVLTGNGLANATRVTIGNRAVPMLDKRDDRVRARIEGRTSGGAVAVYFGSQRENCGSVTVTGR